MLKITKALHQNHLGKMQSLTNYRLTGLQIYRDDGLSSASYTARYSLCLISFKHLSLNICK